MGNNIILGLFTFKQAIDSGEIQIESESHIPGLILSRWWRARGDKAILLEDMLDQVPLLPAICNLAVEVLGIRKNKGLAL